MIEASPAIRLFDDVGQLFDEQKPICEDHPASRNAVQTCLFSKPNLGKEREPVFDLIKIANSMKFVDFMNFQGKLPK